MVPEGKNWTEDEKGYLSGSFYLKKDLPELQIQVNKEGYRIDSFYQDGLYNFGDKK